jgi:ABC-2 type transport system permease protein
MNHLSWVPYVLGIELKKAFSYRLNFWVTFLMGTATELAVAYFLWKSLFAYNQSVVIAGFTFHGLVYYSLFASFSSKITRGTDRGYISQDIYDGSLTRYLLYPLSFFAYKYVTHLTQQLLGFIQFLLAFSCLTLVIGLPSEHNLSIGSFIAGTVTCFVAGYMVFALMSCLEMIAFWQDVIWNLLVMLRFAISLLGGGMVPLVFFPEWGQRLVALTPFPLIVSFPARTFLGQVGLLEWVGSLLVLGIWSIAITFVANFIWSRGTRQYSGVGI